jgi:hypothetical protein
VTDSWPVPKDDIAAAIAIMEAVFPGVSVFNSMPKERPKRFIVVTRAGGAQTAPNTDMPRTLFEFWHEVKSDAYDMTRTGRAGLRNARAQFWAGVWVRSWSNEFGPVDLPHPDIRDRHRYQIHGDLNCSTTQ